MYSLEQSYNRSAYQPSNIGFQQEEDQLHVVWHMHIYIIFLVSQTFNADLMSRVDRQTSERAVYSRRNNVMKLVSIGRY